ncbi:MAG TPA: hypothetical protein VF411_14325 [Bacteroidia bacterium]
MKIADLYLFNFFLLDEKETKSQDKTICCTQATLLRVLSGLRAVFILRWLPKSGAGVHERCELDFFGIERGKCDKKKSSWLSWCIFFASFSSSFFIIFGFADCYAVLWASKEMKIN